MRAITFDPNSTAEKNGLVADVRKVQGATKRPRGLGKHRNTCMTLTWLRSGLPSFEWRGRMALGIARHAAVLLLLPLQQRI